MPDNSHLAESRADSPEHPSAGAAGGRLGCVAIIPDDDWGGYTRRPHLAALKDYGPLLIVEKPMGARRSMTRAPRRRMRRAPDAGENGPFLIQPGSLLPRGPGWLERTRTRHLEQRIRSAMRMVGIERPVVFLTSPSQRWFFDLRIDASAVCFEVSDEYSMYLEYPAARDGRKHAEMVDMVRRSDLVFATARSLATDLAEYSPEVHWVPNTAVPEDFAIDDSTRTLPELEGLEGPVVGFIGGVNPWIDLELLLGIRRLRPSWTIVFSAAIDGPPAYLESDEMRAFRRHAKGIRFLDWVPYERLAGFLAGVDVCALFHRADEVGRYIHPNKIYQYLASGKPLVSTPFLPELADFEGLIRIASDADAFVEAVEQELEQDDDARRRARIACALASRPEVRARAKMEHVERILSARARP